MKFINVIQEIAIASGISMLVLITLVSFFTAFPMPMKSLLFTISFGAVFLVMLIRPLADIFYKVPFLRRLVVLRKGFGILSASIIVAFMLEQLILHGFTYITTMFSASYFSIENGALFAHIGDISGLALLATSNVFSQKTLKGDWKRVQKLAYAYFYAGGLYEAFIFGSSFALYAMIIVTYATVLAWTINKCRKNEQLAVLKA